jgi:NTP pyrophosphatase (non-canonical NTP hydrolase)
MEENKYTFNDYQKLAERTAIYTAKLVYPTLGLAGEAGEFSNKVKKIIRDKQGQVDAESREDMIKELGDVLWYLSACATDLGVTLNSVAEQNIAKLNKRLENNTISGNGDNR